MIIDGVFSGGGVKAFAYVGVLETFKEHHIELERVAGTSAGAIIAAMIAAKYSSEEIKELVSELDLSALADPPLLTKFFPLSKWLFLYFQLGINKGDKLEEWLIEILERKHIKTFSDIKEGYLKVVVSDLSLGKLVVIPDDLERVYGIKPEYFPVSKAVRMSAGFPYFFMPKKVPGRYKQKSIVVDGGLLSNFPLWIFDQPSFKPLRPLIGVKLTEITQEIGPRRIDNAIDMFQALFSTMKQAHDSRYISTNDKKNIIFVPIEGTATMNFSLSEEARDRLILSGKDSTEKFLKKWQG
ncbi:hypothetical conserved protein [Oceanobacillus iheyensis HTE831]|uniref:Hypothetical conserved protein n=1 Tax=Oceanobacillus iheyensis (strain DSM 14371 / CIP 107618 / JCM 11309 / KCTC 3954 / HTE831) TaxID=221109 RepID=Q8EQ24_OCEIH|nr:patatin-like phospholipase family protein [Oceanobacillus iheyensis]BAC13855.1 hypothetical conserved protein [Oceanobacillus iheyensis HTE831]